MSQGSMTSASALFSKAVARFCAALLCPSPKPAVAMSIFLGCDKSSI